MEDVELLVEIEEALAERIAEPLDKLGVRVYVGDKRDGAPKNAQAHDLQVMFIGSQFARPKGFESAGVQDRLMSWQLTMFFQQLFGETHRVSLRVEQVVIHAVKGFRPHHCVNAAFFPQASRLRERDKDGYFSYEIMVGLLDRRSNG